MLIRGTSTTAAYPTLTWRQLRQLMAAGLIGSSIEWYDFSMFGTAAALVFGPLFLPMHHP